MNDSPIAIALQPIVSTGQPFSDNGTPLYDDHFDIFWFDKAHQSLWLMHRAPPAYHFADNTKPQQISAQDLADQTPDVTAGDQLLSRRISALDMSTPEGAITYPLALHMTVEVPDPKGGIERFDLTTAVTPRNAPW